MKIGTGGNGIEGSRIWGSPLQIMERPKWIIFQEACQHQNEKRRIMIPKIKENLA